jgi:hypothetical protein
LAQFFVFENANNLTTETLRELALLMTPPGTARGFWGNRELSLKHPTHQLSRCKCAKTAHRFWYQEYACFQNACQADTSQTLSLSQRNTSKHSPSQTATTITP